MFDPEALERGAKALREIDRSTNAKQVLELTRQQEVTRQQELRTREAEFQAAAHQSSVEREQVHWEQQSKAQKERAQQQAELARYEDQLARERAKADGELVRQRNAELVKMQEDSTRRQAAEKRRLEEQIQAERRASDRFRAELETEKVRTQALAEAEGRIQEGRANEDVHRREMLLRAEQEREKALALLRETLAALGAAGLELLQDRGKMTVLVGGLSALALGVYAAREGTRVLGRSVDRYLGTPSLVRETSRRWFWQGRPAGGELGDSLKDIVLGGTLSDRVRMLASNLTTTKARNAPFRHMLFYGPPGTGKTMTAKVLARQSGLDYAIMSGGDIAPLGGGAVTQIHDLFEWSKRSRKGVLLFIDEADAFLTRRTSGEAPGAMSEGLRAALNALLYQTGDQSREFVMVLATNRPSDLDAAVLDRVDDSLEFPLPDAASRQELMRKYLDHYVISVHLQSASGIFAKSHPQIPVKVTEKEVDAALKAAAKATEGFSARELAKLMASVQSAAYGSAEGALTKALLDDTIKTKLAEHKQKAAFSAA